MSGEPIGLWSYLVVPSFTGGNEVPMGFLIGGGQEWYMYCTCVKESPLNWVKVCSVISIELWLTSVALCV